MIPLIASLWFIYHPGHIATPMNPFVPTKPVSKDCIYDIGEPIPLQCYYA